MDQTEIDVINAYIKNLAERVQSLTVEILYQKSKMQCLERDLVIKNEAIDEMQRLLGGEAHIVKPAETTEEYAGGVIEKEESESEYSLTMEEVVEESVSEYSSAPVQTPSIPNTRRQRQQVPPQPQPAPVQRQVTAPPKAPPQEVKTGQTLGSETVVISDGGEYTSKPPQQKPVVVEAPEVEEKRAEKQLSTRGKGDRSQRRRRRTPLDGD